jgi:hypothetical protein
MPRKDGNDGHARPHRAQHAAGRVRLGGMALTHDATSSSRRRRSTTRIEKGAAVAALPAASTRCAAIRTARSAASRASCARRCARRRRSPSRPRPREDGTRRTTRYDIDMTKCIYCGLCRGSLPGRCHRRGAELRVRDRDARGAALRQGQAARRTATAGSRDRRKRLELDAPYR